MCSITTIYSNWSSFNFKNHNACARADVQNTMQREPQEIDSCYDGKRKILLYEARKSDLRPIREKLEMYEKQRKYLMSAQLNSPAPAPTLEPITLLVQPPVSIVQQPIEVKPQNLDSFSPSQLQKEFESICRQIRDCNKDIFKIKEEVSDLKSQQPYSRTKKQWKALVTSSTSDLNKSLIILSSQKSIVRQAIERRKTTVQIVSNKVIKPIFVTPTTPPLTPKNPTVVTPTTPPRTPKNATFTLTPPPPSGKKPPPNGNNSSQKEIDYVNILGKSVDDVFDIFLGCIPSRVGFLSHPLNKFENKDDRTLNEYILDIIPLMFEELRAQITKELESRGAVVMESGHYNFDHLAKTSCLIGDIDMPKRAGEGVHLYLDYPYTRYENQLNIKDMVLLRLPGRSVFGQVIGANLFSKTKEQRVIIRIMDNQSYAPHTSEFIDALYQTRKDKGKVNLSYVNNFTTFERELNAVRGFTQHALAPLILAPKLYSIFKTPISPIYVMPTIVGSLLSSQLNSSQFRAISQSLASPQISLIQGPPGTGKTKTIISLLAIFNTILKPTEQILVCAPSNVAVDEVGLRVLKDGLLDNSGGRTDPSIARIGRLEAINENIHQICVSKHRRASYKKKMIQSSRIILSTLSGAGSQLIIHSGFRPSVVIVDESTQSCESSTLIPLLRNPNSKIILIGDPKQLPPTVFSGISSRFNYDVSLFERLAKYFPVHMLDTQYRMHPKISKFPSLQFYNSKLKDGENVAKYHNSFYTDPKYGPINFYHIPDSQELKTIGNSIMNDLEIRLVFTLLKKLVQDHPEVKSMSVGIITPYKLQKKVLQDAKNHFNEKMDVVVNTVDGFQGAEKDIIIFSCVRSEKIGFLKDTRRINVGITRARRALYIVGSAKLLEQDPNWGAYLRDIKSTTKRLVSIDSNGIRMLEEQVRQFDIANPDDLIDTSQEDFKELEDFFDDNDERILKDIGDDDDGEDDSEEEEEEEVVGNNEVSMDMIVSKLKSMTLWKNSTDPSIPLKIKEIEQYLGEYNQLREIRINSTIRAQIVETRKSIWTGLRDTLKKLKIENSKHDVSDLEFIAPNDNDYMSRQLLSLYREKKCPNEDIKKKSLLSLENHCQKAFPGSILKPYGSFVNGVQTASSDIDLCFSVVGVSTDTNDKLFHLMKRVALRIKKNTSYQLEKIIRFARVPIIKFKDIENEISFDMCFNNSMPVGNSLLIKEYTMIDVRAKVLMLLIKYWASRKDINDASMGTLSSYSWLLMVIFYLQSINPPVLPNLQSTLINTAPKNAIISSSEDRWLFLSSQALNFKSTNTMSLFQLFSGFFSFYSRFDFSNLLITIKQGCLTNIRMATKIFLDNNGKQNICIEDPFTPQNNPAASVGRNAFDVILYELKSAEQKLSALKPNETVDVFMESTLMKFCSAK
ncbi:Regulator of nonsense transcripts-like protein [Heterostelium album PN500]|uniref:Regulator of nonsense transcripts-like protein n=1 Tax=Heterostelium pallidum (strain ATCC 26659 / Pp 5 / PN500) TaxID=670386 RepID=D3AZ60_HETP5|nr:Regulator of nonsense transcripts-like protein [Heterostelium album PN500]EFA85443.1 Regulator of nonsense transcripts-like protein [Heterostelium album PN500]|eukprot:XP_020437552.1 Regulator of nonsense transcripts-like protein [Heterostelium album PN500]